MFLEHCSEELVVVEQKKALMLKKVRKASPKTFKHSVLTQNDIESNLCNVALAVIVVCSRPCKSAQAHWYLHVHKSVSKEVGVKTPFELDILQKLYYDGSVYGLIFLQK